MMKRMKHVLLAMGLVLGISLSPMQAQAAEYINITDYTETMTPVNGLDGQLEVAVTGEAGEDGYLYLMSSVKDMAPVGEITGENLDGTELEAYTEGNVNYFRVKVKDPAVAATVQAQFSCAGFYDVKEKADTNGAANSPISFKFTNSLESKIGKYSITIFVPEGQEIAKVTKPSAYADFKLSEVNGLRGVGISKGLASSAAAELAFTFDKPFASSGFGKILVWVICLAVGGFVFVDRFKKSKKET